MLRAHPRIAVVGTSGCGKTTFARELAGVMGREHIELDALYWGPSWTSKPEFPALVSAAVARDTWIIDGNYSGVRDLIWAQATALVWLDYPFRVIFGRALARRAADLASRAPLRRKPRVASARAPRPGGDSLVGVANLPPAPP